ncbi:hypothetical protein GOP47_0012172 [Adiantum capillus-veneris]|uniref:Uncharacterized protein n=1 Tax=Adiantum capillus-veneris TaxID=13818 RepID=A0A9D4UQF8_ADICA|nr:hypothetical protein GOP47_0012172 [Adiantum capillus-veneris]
MDWDQENVEGDHMLEELFDEASSDVSSESIDDDFEILHEEGDATRESRPLEDQMVKVFPDPNLYVSTTYFSFHRETYNYMIRVLQSDLSTTLKTLKTYDSRDMLDLKKWRKMKDELYVGLDEDRRLCLYLGDSQPVRVPCIEDWEDIVKVAHIVEGSKHQGFNKTLISIKSKWCIEVRKHGISTIYIKEYINACGCSNATNASSSRSWRQRMDLNKSLQM